LTPNISRAGLLATHIWYMSISIFLFKIRNLGAENPNKLCSAS